MCCADKLEKGELGMLWDDIFQLSPYNAVPDKALDSMWCPPTNSTHINPERRLSCCKSWTKVCMELLPPLPHQNFRQCQTTPVQFMLRQQLLDCSKQCVQSQHRAGESTAVGTSVSRCFKPSRREWGQRLVIKSKEHKILSNTHTIQETFPLKLLLQGHSFHQYKQEAQERSYSASRHSIWNMLYCLCKYC